MTLLSRSCLPREIQQGHFQRGFIPSYNQNSSPDRFFSSLREISPNLLAYSQRHNAAYQTHQTYLGKSPLILKVHTFVNNFSPPTSVLGTWLPKVHYFFTRCPVRQWKYKRKYRFHLYPHVFAYFPSKSKLGLTNIAHRLYLENVRH